MPKCLFFIFCFLQIFDHVSAQSFCSNDMLDNKWKIDNPEIAKHILQEQQNWLKYNKAKTLSKIIVSGKDTAYEVPIVFHIVHTGDTIGSEFNPSNAQIDSIVNFLNATWAATWSSYLDSSKGGTYIPIKFVLAKRDPNCNATTGINRIDGTVFANYKNYGICPAGSYPGPTDDEIKNLSIWPSYDYLNIWVVNKIENGTLGGYAPWPWYASGVILDGVVIGADKLKRSVVLGGNFDFAIVHEIGHAFGLYHTFQDGCDAGASCLIAGDQLCDTEPHTYAAFACDSGKLNSCTGKIFDGVEHNFMNYTTCPNRFTKDQKERILYTMHNYRMGLVNSLGATLPAPSYLTPISSICKLAISKPVNSYNAGPRNIQFANLITSSSGYNGDGNQYYIDRTCSQEAAIVTAGDTISISVSTEGKPNNVTVWIDYKNDGNFDLTELVMSHTGTLDTENHTGTVIIPKSGIVFDKYLRMRVIADYMSIPSACTYLLNGQAEDYSVFIKGSVAIEEQKASKNSAHIFPNPANDKIFIQATMPVNIELYGLDGRVLIVQKLTQNIDVSTLSAGLYFMQISNATSGLVLGFEKVIIIK